MKIILTNSKLTAEIDDADYMLAAFRWILVTRHKKQYAAARINGRFKYLHRVVMGDIPRGKIVDHHPDPSGLNCRRSNLRLCTRSQNMGNAKGRCDRKGPYKGVSVEKSSGKFVAQICCQGKHIKIGRYKTAKEAALAYDAKARELFGEFAKGNFK